MKVTNFPSSWPGKYWKPRHYENNRVIFLGEITQRVTYSENPGSQYSLYICRESEGDYVHVSSMTLSPPPLLTLGACKTYAVLAAKNISYSLSGYYNGLIRNNGLFCWKRAKIIASFKVANVSAFIKATISHDGNMQHILQNTLETTLCEHNGKHFKVNAIQKSLNRSIYHYGIKCDRVSEGEQVLSYDNLPPSCLQYNQLWLDNKNFEYEIHKRKKTNETDNTERKKNAKTTIDIIKNSRRIKRTDIRKGLAIENKDPNSLNEPRKYQD